MNGQYDFYGVYYTPEMLTDATQEETRRENSMLCEEDEMEWEIHMSKNLPVLHSMWVSPLLPLYRLEFFLGHIEERKKKEKKKEKEK